jgi:hypothetical protein
MNDVLELFHDQFERRHARTSILELTEDSVRYDFFAALMAKRGLPSWEIHLEPSIDKEAYVRRNNEKSKRTENPRLDLAFGDGAERVYVEFALFKKNSVPNSPINDTENAFKVLNDMMRLALHIKKTNGRGFFVCVSDHTMLGKQLSRSERFSVFPALRYEFDHGALHEVANLYTTSKKLDPRFMETLRSSGIVVRADKVFERDLRPTENGKEVKVLAWEVTFQG